MNGIDLHYKVEGSGEALVFIHGISDNLLYWEFLTNNLKDDFKVLRIDLRGHGESKLGSEEITVDLYVEDLISILDELGIDSANLIGFSLGGAVALDFAVKHPKRVSSLVLMSTFFKVDDYVSGSLGQSKRALNSSFEDFYDLMISKVLCPDVIEENREELNLIKEFSSKTANAQAYLKAIDACLDFNIENDLSGIEVPALVLAGKYDEITSLAMQKELHGKIKNSKIIVFDNVKHNLLVGKNNEKVLNILKNFYKKRE